MSLLRGQVLGAEAAMVQAVKRYRPTRCYKLASCGTQLVRIGTPGAYWALGALTR